MNNTLVTYLNSVCELILLAAIVISDIPCKRLIMAPGLIAFMGIMPPNKPIVTK